MARVSSHFSLKNPTPAATMNVPLHHCIAQQMRLTRLSYSTVKNGANA
ncbi:hypothetical protein HMPREF3192_00559 [Atopobium deltae]|uniref:Uncharacterized protein n=1 Tax=Atopobium deltae TaxID=1393034 RepID=A0A133XW62_9ACTN|nr:hypothetical protein HMPREF3192_00559 [Atopobium deltae]